MKSKKSTLSNTKTLKSLKNPNRLKLGKMKSKKGKLFVVSKKGTKKIWRFATKDEKKCHKFLQSKIQFNLLEYKKKKYKSPKQAIAVAYSQTKQKYPNCKL
jgi:hypothetical protein